MKGKRWKTKIALRVFTGFFTSLRHNLAVSPSDSTYKDTSQWFLPRGPDNTCCQPSFCSLLLHGGSRCHSRTVVFVTFANPKFSYLYWTSTNFKKINCSLWTGWGFCTLCILSESWWNVNQTCPCDIWLHKVFELLVLLCVTVKMKSFQSIMRAAVNAVALRDPRSISDADMYSLLHACTHSDTH